MSEGPLDPDLCNGIPVFFDHVRECLGDEVEGNIRNQMLRHGYQAPLRRRPRYSGNNTFFIPKREDILGSSLPAVVEDTSGLEEPTISRCMLHRP